MNMIQSLILLLAMTSSILAADAPANWAVVVRPTRLMAGQQQLGQLDAGSVVPIGQVAANGWASATAELRGKTVSGWALATDLWMAGPIKPTAESVYQKGLELITQANLRDSTTFVTLASTMAQEPIYTQTRQILEAIANVLKSRQQAMPKIAEKIARAAKLEKDGMFQMQAKSVTGRQTGEAEGAEKVSQARGVRQEAATEQRELDDKFYNAMNDVGTYVDNLSAAGAWDVAVALESIRAIYLGQVSSELLKRSGAGPSRMMPTDTQNKQPVSVVAKKIEAARAAFADVNRQRQTRSLVAALTSADKGLAEFPYHRTLPKVRAEIAPEIDKVRELLKQMLVARQAADLTKAEQFHQEAQKIAADADDLLPSIPVPPPPAPATNAPPATTTPKS